MIDRLSDYKGLIEKEISNLQLPNSPENLYEPLRYFLQIGGKRMRPILALLSAELFGTKKEIALKAAMCVELFHNFSLIHDDIMDEAPLRRGQETVHQKWNTNIGILSGDALLIEACKQLSYYPAEQFKTLTQLFNKTAIEVCEGQQMDMDFETRENVSKEEYLEMIKLKTAVLLGCSLQMGAITANASQSDQQKIYEFGVNLGIAFQLQDDILDAFGDDQTGKQVGGDIIANKKTYLLISALDQANTTQKTQLFSALSITNNSEKVKAVLAIFEELDIQGKSKKMMAHFHDLALKNLNEISIEKNSKTALLALADFLFQRQY